MSPRCTQHCFQSPKVVFTQVEKPCLFSFWEWRCHPFNPHGAAVFLKLKFDDAGFSPTLQRCIGIIWKPGNPINGGLWCIGPVVSKGFRCPFLLHRLVFVLGFPPLSWPVPSSSAINPGQAEHDVGEADVPGRPLHAAKQDNAQARKHQQLALPCIPPVFQSPIPIASYRSLA